MLISVSAKLQEVPGTMAVRPVYATPEEAVADIRDGSMIALGGFSAGLGAPNALLRAIAEGSQKDLTFIGNGIPQASTGNPDRPFFVVEPARVRKVICSFPAPASTRRGFLTPYEQAFGDGTTELELVPQGTLAERLRAGGAGIPAFFTPTGVGTQFADGKEVREFDGRQFVMERALRPDYALVRAHRADKLGNLFYRNTARAFNPPMAMAARLTIAEVEEIVEPGELDADLIATPGIYVHRLVVVKRQR